VPFQGDAFKAIGYENVRTASSLLVREAPSLDRAKIYMFALADSSSSSSFDGASSSAVKPTNEFSSLVRQLKDKKLKAREDERREALKSESKGKQPSPEDESEEESREEEEEEEEGKSSKKHKKKNKKKTLASMEKGEEFVCAVCDGKKFPNVKGLNRHLNSPMHSQRAKAERKQQNLMKQQSVQDMKRKKKQEQKKLKKMKSVSE
jgi:hypothetical protein